MREGAAGRVRPASGLLPALARATVVAMATASESTPLERALDLVGDRWTLLVTEALLGGARRFSDLQAVLPGIATNILSGRLAHLERAGLVVARPYSRRPPRSAYELTAGGLELAGALRALADWGGRRGPSGEPLRHEACGTPLEARWYCPTCGHSVDDDEAAHLHYV
jgi:DNA-binding HxlR family transcriptional regulator